MRIDEAIREANRCLYCYNAPCVAGCPAEIDIPGFIKAIQTRDFKTGARFVFEANCLGGTCARVCSTNDLCEGRCVLNKLEGHPVEIAKLQRFVTDLAFENNWQIFKRGEPIGLKAGIIGAGPAGIACAVELSQLGWDVTIFESRERPGGLNTYVISPLKITSSFALKEIKFLKSPGIKIKTGITVGIDISVEDLLKKYDCVFIGAGLERKKSLQIPGENSNGVVDAFDFIEMMKFKNYNEIKVGREIVVIGGGNTALDSAIAARRIGAEVVKVLYRRTEKEMPAFSKTFEQAKLAGIHFHWLISPIKILVKNEKVTGIKCVKMKLGRVDKSGRPRPIPIEGSEHTMPCDMVIKGFGQIPLRSFLNAIPELTINKSGFIEVNPKTGATSILRLFAGGDCVNGGKEVVHAVRDGKIAAKGMHSFCMNTIAV